MKTLELRFKDTNNRVSTVGIPHPTEPVDAVEVNRVMDELIATEALGSHEAKVTHKVSARVVQRNVEQIELPLE